MLLANGNLQNQFLEEFLAVLDWSQMIQPDENLQLEEEIGNGNWIWSLMLEQLLGAKFYKTRDSVFPHPNQQEI